ncbi:unnamed protein product [Phytomonas sp. EM1]|nr:unnamed protein product [Phytomonas sp. EM1]|eukprot:CCW64152.1 unnamed protein product [Phytomonas sp. isolate EM1]
MFSPSKPMRPPRPRPQDNNNGISYVHSHRCLSAHKDSVGIRHFRPHIPKYMSFVTPSGVQPEKDDQTPDSMNHNADINFRVCDSNCPIYMNSATAAISNDCVLQGHISSNQNLLQPFGDTCEHFMHIGNTKHTYNINYTRRDGETVPMRSITPNFNRHRSCTRNTRQINGLQPRGWFPSQSASGKPETLHQTEALLDPHVGPTQLRQQRALSVLSATRASECDNASHEYSRDCYLSKEHFLLPQAPLNFRRQRESIIAESLQGNINEGKQRDCHDANILSPQRTVYKLSSGGEIGVSKKRHHNDHRLPIVLDTCAKIQDKSVLVPGEAIDINVKERIVHNEEIFKPTHVPIRRYPSVTAFPQNALSRTHFSQFSTQSSHCSSVQFDTNFVSILKIVRITPLPSRARLQMPPLLASVSYMQSNPQECENIMKRLYCALSDESATHITDNFFQHDTGSVHNSLELDGAQMCSAKECAALRHMSVGSGYNLSSDTPLSLLPHSIISCGLASPGSLQRSIVHSENNNLCNQSEHSLLTNSIPYRVNNRQDSSTNRKHSLLSSTSILEATAQVVLGMIATTTCSKAPDSEHLSVEITPEVAGHEIASKEVSLQSLPQLPIMVTQRDKHALSFTPNSNAFSSKKSLGTFDGLTRPTATTPEESTEMELYGSEYISGIEFSHSPMTVSVNPNCFSMPFNKCSFFAKEMNIS